MAAFAALGAAATLTLATCADLKVVQDLLGHSSITITADTYAHVLPELARETAEATARIVPRARPGEPDTHSDRLALTQANSRENPRFPLGFLAAGPEIGGAAESA